MRDHSRIKRVVGVVTVRVWASAALMAVLVVLSWVAPGVQDTQSFNLLGGTSVEAGDEWTSKAWLYAIAFGLSFAFSWLLLPSLFLSF